MATIEINIIKQQTKKLPSKEKIELIKFLTEGLADAKSRNEPKYLKFGEFRDYPGKMSTEADFKIAEWHPTEAKLDGD